MPYDEAARNLDLFAREVLPELKKIPEPKAFKADNDVEAGDKSKLTADWA